ncbi:hypothetical protein AB0P36_32930 [Streptomyces flavidovirens]|uniref:hypothetical protein n=1 Tax=Streptomyces flavidovirens TaxID=67298 RepID=UPI0034395779
MSLMPMTDALFDSVADGSDAGALGFWRLPGGFEKTLAYWSTDGPVAYVEAEYFGGVGEQKAAVWYGGTIVLGRSMCRRASHFRLLAVRSLRHFDGWA